MDIVQWEYKEVMFCGLRNKEEQKLKDLGKHGWEAVTSFSSLGENGSDIVLFKRPCGSIGLDDILSDEQSETEQEQESKDFALIRFFDKK